MSRVRNFVEPFALTVPKVPEMIKLDPEMADVHGGVSITDANKVDGLLVLMLAYLGQAVNQTLTLYVNGTKGPHTTIAEGKENVDTPLRLPAGLLQKGLNRIKIHIERTSGNGEFTPELVLYHRTSPPGDLPPVLNLTVSHKVINQAEADKFKVTVTYANVQWYDLIFVSCNGVHHIYQLTPSVVSPLPPVPKSVVIDIPKDKLIEGGNDKTFEIKYRVVDYLTNPSGPPTWSDAVFVEVDLDKISQEPPTLVNAVSPIDVLASEGGVKVRAEFKAALANDKATLKIVDGLPGSSFPQVAFNTNQRANFTFSVAFLLAHQGKTIQVSWVLIRDGVPSGESPPLEVVIDKIAVDDPRLPTPNIAGEMGQQLNVPELPNDARVLTEKIPLMQQTHPVWVDFEGVDADGNPVTKEVSTGGPSELADRISLLAQVEWLKNLKDGSPLRVVCAVNLDGVMDKTKAVPLRVRSYTIRAAEDLLAPKIRQAQDNSLDPFAAKDALTALVFDPSIQLDDVIQVRWLAAPGTPADGSYTSPPHLVKVLGTQEIALDNKVLAYSFGGNVTVDYSKTTGSATRDSLPLILSVQDIADGDPRLPTPTIDRVTGDELNPADLLPTDHTRTTAWPLIAVGQRVDLTYREIKSDGSAGIIEQAYKGKEVTTEDLGGLKHPVPVAKLASLADRSTLKLEVQVNFDGNESGRKVAFPTRAYNVSKGFDDLTTFTDYDWNNWELRHGGRPFIQFNDGEYFLVSAQDSNQYYSIQLSKSFNEIPGRQLFELSFNYRSIHNVSFEFSHNELNGPVVSLPRGSNWQYHKAIFSMPKPLRLLYLYAATTNGNFDIDNIRLRQVNN
ncbi:hypothetical protein [Pseudomonas sp. Sample_11]|uniref:hypothetical protein n=1 Tax=Pseudomonas sp. Sample_11 TaxID=2448261 RepID=UPI001032B9F0|nr:hypothetical protein [Pseudomonas sp. Sample_11]